ncbi:MAG: 3-coathanger stack domain-containing protein [Bacteroidota bacterium]
MHGSNLYKYDCEPACPAAGTACNDGNSNTTNDLEDGDCRCIGTPTNPPPTCVGDRGGLIALYYDGISGSFVSSLLAAAKYPEAPDRADILRTFEGPVSTGFSSYGTRARGYLRPPVTGNYIFNVTGDNEVRLRFRTVAGDTATTADEIAWNDGFSDDYDHYNTPQQTSDTLFLTAGNFYPIELLHKQNTGSNDYFVFWKTPFARDTSWHIIDGTYLYRYGCEWICIPNNTPCNDNDPDTFNDKYTACACAGTPCSDPECTNSLDYTPLEPCDTSENHSTNPNASWLSCQESQSPNPERGLSHWIQYDFGANYALDDAKIWNYNALGATGQGFEQVVIDVSFDGVNWSELGTYNWTEATGNGSYAGFISTVFQGVSARYVLFTALSNFDGTDCFGISEIYFNAETCPPAGTPCDDGDPETINDAYNEFCYCIGEFNLVNDWDVVHLVKNEMPVLTGEYDAEMTINSAGLVRSGFEVVYLAGESITLNGNFEVELGADFLAQIAPCDQNSNSKPGKKKGKKKKLN